jgi:phosphate-selective porin OprO/OprP
MKLAPRLLAAAIVAALASSAHAEIAIDVIGSTEVSLEGLMQADYNDFDNDRLDLNAPSTNNDGDDTEFEQRRAEVILKGKGVKFDWTVGYDGKANKWLDSYLAGSSAPTTCRAASSSSPTAWKSWPARATTTSCPRPW